VKTLGFEKAKFVKAIIIGLLYYAVALVIDGLGNSIVPDYVNVMSYVWWIVSATTIFLLTRYYYFRQKPKKPLTDGLLLGILLAVITFIVEVPLIVYGFGMGLEIYLIWLVWIQYILVIILPIIAALMK
jgi:hypothetical protein